MFAAVSQSKARQGDLWPQNPSFRLMVGQRSDSSMALTAPPLIISITMTLYELFFPHLPWGIYPKAPSLPRQVGLPAGTKLTLKRP